MKLETAIVTAKGVCLVYIPTMSTLSEKLDDRPIPHLFGLSAKTIATATVVGAGGVLAFLSQSFGKFMTDRTDAAATPSPITPSTPDK